MARGTLPSNAPVEESGRIDQIDPQLMDAGAPAMRIGSANPVFQEIGADAVNPVPPN